jgi:enamine deaminase RidA (YjgF/YER057c/UK114 family)
MTHLLKIAFGISLISSLTACSSIEIKRINPETLLDTSGYGFSQVVVAPNNGRTVYLSGQFSGNTKGEVLGKTVKEQMYVAFGNLKHAIEASGAKPEHVVKIQVLIVNHKEEYTHTLQEELSKLFGDHLPASTLIPVPRLALDNMLFEIDATLVIPH